MSDPNVNVLTEIDHTLAELQEQVRELKGVVAEQFRNLEEALDSIYNKRIGAIEQAHLELDESLAHVVLLLDDTLPPVQSPRPGVVLGGAGLARQQLSKLARTLRKKLVAAEVAKAKEDSNDD